MRDLCRELGGAKGQTQLSMQVSRGCFFTLKSRDPFIVIIDHILMVSLRLKSGDLVNMSGTWDPCEVVMRRGHEALVAWLGSESGDNNNK